MKGTRLWQAPGSPIIQGRSRTERPFWEKWLGAVAGAGILMFGVAILDALRTPGLTIGSASAALAFAFLVPALPGTMIGAAIGVWLSRTMGWRRHLIVGTLMGAAFGALSIAIL